MFSIFARGAWWGVLGLSTFYFLLLFAVTQDLSHPWNQFILLQPWISLLILGFGIQVGLFWLLRKGFPCSTEQQKDTTLATGTSTFFSGGAMVACCAHHLVEILPIIGFSAAALFLSEYQQQLLIFGVLANLAGILMMLMIVKSTFGWSVKNTLITAKMRRVESE